MASMFAGIVSINHSQFSNWLICYLRQSRSVIRPTVSLGNHNNTIKPTLAALHYSNSLFVPVDVCFP